jgi:hypothetical protein
MGSDAGKLIVRCFVRFRRKPSLGKPFSTLLSEPGWHSRSARPQLGRQPPVRWLGQLPLRVLVEEGMIENEAVQGARFLDGLRSIRSNTIPEVRGVG